MRNVTTALVLAAFSSSAFANGLVIKPEIIGTNSKLSIDKAEINTGLGTVEINGSDNEKSKNGLGAGVALEYEVLEKLRLNGGVSYRQYEKKSDISQNDFVVRGGLSYDVFNQDKFSLYASGGLSYHIVGISDSTDDDLKLKTDDFNLLNYDLGLGGRYQATDKVSVGLEYRFSDTLYSKDTKLEMIDIHDGEKITGKFKDIKLRNNEVMASVSYAL